MLNKIYQIASLMNSPLPDDSSHFLKEDRKLIDGAAIELNAPLAAVPESYLPGLFGPDVNLNIEDEK
ncbi:unnamed protein product [Gongylonema pulchrum]|uniref:Transcriptional regulator n=1 Tax=Gongylonema pulchrum TaxID=637853 RepID=A0A183DGK2_9BILA|nr:unnamed protein product [Gongylonema pulchrum]